MASVAGFVLAAILAGIAVADCRAGPHADRPENRWSPHRHQIQHPGGPGDDSEAGGQKNKRALGTRGDPAASGATAIVGSGAE